MRATRRIKIILIRHARSCSNLTGDSTLSDPQLTEQGVTSARRYGPVLQKIRDVDVHDSAMVAVGSSGLQRARQTAALLFPTRAKSLVDFPHIRKDIPNTPRDARAFFRHLYGLSQQTFIIVVHKGFVLKDVVRALHIRPRKSFNNMDALVIIGEFDENGEAVGEPQVVWRRMHSRPQTRRDRCSVTDRRKTRRN